MTQPFPHGKRHRDWPTSPPRPSPDWPGMFGAETSGNADLLAQLVRLRGLKLVNRPRVLRAVAASGLRRDIRRVLTIDPDHRVGNYLMGRWHLGVPAVLGGAPTDAVEYFLRSAAASDAGDTRALLGAAESCEIMGDVDRARELLQRVVTETPTEHPRHHVRTSRAQAMLMAIDERADRASTDDDIVDVSITALDWLLTDLGDQGRAVLDELAGRWRSTPALCRSAITCATLTPAISVAFRAPGVPDEAVRAQAPTLAAWAVQDAGRVGAGDAVSR